MYNYINTTISLLVKMGLLTEDAGQHLSVELGKKIHFDKYNQSFMTVEEVVNELEKKDKKFLVEPWMAHIRQLEKKVSELTEELEKNQKHYVYLLSELGKKVQSLEIKPSVKPLPKKDLTAKK